MTRSATILAFAWIACIMMAHHAGAASPPTSPPTGRLPLAFEPTRPFAMQPDGQIIIEGDVGTSGSTVVLRVDDMQTPAYSQRMNEERNLPPGPFQITIRAAHFNASDGRPLNLQNLWRIVLFAPNGETAIAVTRFTVDHSKAATPATARTPGRKSPLPPIAPTGSTSLASGQLPLAYEPSRRFALTPTDEISVEGQIETGGATVVLRIDDTQAPPYNDRYNEERALPAGPFRIALRADQLRATGGRTMNAQSLYRVLFFATEGESRVHVSSLAITRNRKKTTDRSTLTLGTGTAPIRYTPSNVFSGRGRQFIVEGENNAAENRTMVLRIDDQQSYDYSSRANIERELPPGRFRFTIAADGLVTPRKRTLDPDALRLALVAPWPETSDIVISRFDLAPIPKFPEGTVAIAFGAPNAPLPQGFERLSIGDRRIQGDNLQVRNRPKPDPLVANGIRGINRIQLKAPTGRQRVTIWSEDPGEWEDLPRALDRSIHVNGMLLHRAKLSPQQWLAQHYLGGQSREHTKSDDAWTAFGRHRGNPQSIDVEFIRHDYNRPVRRHPGRSIHLSRAHRANKQDGSTSTGRSKPR